MSKSFLTMLQQRLLYPKYFIQGRLRKATMTLTNLKNDQGNLIGRIYFNTVQY